MAHERLRRFETARGNTMCVGVRAANHVVLSGTGSALGDAATQADEAMASIQGALEEAGAGVEHITRVTAYMTDRAWWEAVDGVIRGRLGTAAPARVGVIVAGLAAPQTLVAIDVDAVTPA